jgi:hypothetical protein
MKTQISFFLLLGFTLVTLVMKAQESQDTTKYLLSEKTEISGFGGPFVEFSAIDNQFAVCLGGGFGFMINKTAFLGGYFEGIVTNQYMEDLNIYVNIEKPKVSFEHGGFWLGYVYKHKKPVHGGVSLKLGWGEISLDGDGYEYDPDLDYDYTDKIFTIIPQAELEMNMTRWFRINVGIGYRWVTGIDATYINSSGNEVNFYNKSDFNSPVGTVTLIFGGPNKKD